MFFRAPRTQVENDIASSRKYYNTVVREYNTKQEVFPANIVGNMMHLERTNMYEVEGEQIHRVIARKGILRDKEKYRQKGCLYIFLAGIKCRPSTFLFSNTLFHVEVYCSDVGCSCTRQIETLQRFFL